MRKKLLILIIIILGIFIISVFFISRKEDKLILSIKPSKNTFRQDELITFNARLFNLSLNQRSTSWNNCAEIKQYYLDNKPILKETTSICLIGSPPILPLRTLTQSISIDGNNIKPGKHTFQIKINSIKSNITSFLITRGEKTDNCYEYSKDISTNCSQLLIHTNINSANSEKNNQRCKEIKDKLITGTKLKPIPSLSTINCENGDSAYFVINIPKEDLNEWKNILRNAGDYTKEGNVDIFTEWTTLDYANRDKE